MTGNRNNLASRNRLGEMKIFGVTMAMVTLLGGCALRDGPDGPCEPREPPEPQPLLAGERVGWVRVDTVPGCLTVRLVSQLITNGPGEMLQPPEKEGEAPQLSIVSYKPGFHTRLIVRAFLKDPPPENTAVTLQCEAYADGEVLPGSDDSEIVNEYNQATAFVLCAFDERLAPRLPD